MSADYLHPAIDIPGGLWRSAEVAVTAGPSLGLRGLVRFRIDNGSQECEVALDTKASVRVADLALVLPGEMGLGLAGLAGRVAERCGYEWSPADGIDDLAEMLADERWAPVPWRYWYEDDLSVQVIREAATLLARLDRLVARAWPDGECRCLPGAVPTWERGLAGGLTPAWLLTCGPCGVAAWLLTDHPGLDTPDPLAALGAALEVCGA